MSRRLVAALLLAGALAACAADEDPPATRSSPSPSPTQTARTSPLDGSITVSYTVEEVKAAGISDHEACENAGTHRIELRLGRWTFEQTPAQGCSAAIAGTGDGTFSVSGDVVSFNEPAAFGCGVDYSYRFTISGSSVTFALGTDPCEVRRIVFTSKPWTKAA